VNGERRGRGDRGDPVLALALQELVERQDDGVDEVQREHVQADQARLARQLGGLAQRGEQLLAEDVGRSKKHGEAEEDEPRALQVDAHHVVLLCTVGLAAQRLHCTRHANLHAKCICFPYVDLYLYMKNSCKKVQHLSDASNLICYLR